MQGPPVYLADEGRLPWPPLFQLVPDVTLASLKLRNSSSGTGPQARAQSSVAYNQHVPRLFDLPMTHP